ncbi:MAG: DEAD/DEAH box helicase [Acidimicrobiia bacterium]|nr:DEAD/DEAH box helicase [Acidimicrobiia bacterium]
MADTRSARQVLAEHEALLAEVGTLESLPAGVADVARAQVSAIRRAVALGQMAQVPVARLRETAKGLRLDALERTGYRTVDQLLGATAARLRAVPGVGDATATQALAAARQVLAATEAAVRVHFDVVARPAAQTDVLVSLRRYDLAARAVDESQAMSQWLRATASPLAVDTEPAARPWLRRIFVRAAAKTAANVAVEQLDRILADPSVVQFRQYLATSLHEINRPRAHEEVWIDFEHNAAHLLGVLGEIVEGTGEEANRGHLPAEIVERVQALALDLSFLKASLRGYQAFGAKYALVQRRTILGDEMGLGKTVEALAALCHLRAAGKQRAMVVCPASVVANWRSEIHRHTELAAHVLHGAERDRAHRSWLRQGGVAITTFDGLRRFDPADPDPNADGADSSLAMLVVDEAHYVKNPATLRSQAVARWADGAERVLFLTGTPMENRVEEFRNLIDHLQPEVAVRVNAATALAGPVAFQTAVAPAYLRRNQIDVLNELPEQIPSLDWVDPTPEDLRTYRAAVEAQAFQTMRRAAYTSIPDGGPAAVLEIEHSAKTARLVDILEEASEEGLKVVVFSYFRDVLDRVTRAANVALPGAVYGPLTGSTPPAERQRLVDALGARPGGGVLTSQIEAGGVGLNIQAASVVILCEPQWKPTVEAQAVARCHRMGQVRRVQVHRLLLEDTVDQRMLAVLAGKQHLIEQFVLGSAVKDATPDSVDISDLQDVQKIVNETQAEALILASERRRLGIEEPASPAPA